MLCLTLVIRASWFLDLERTLSSLLFADRKATMSVSGFTSIRRLPAGVEHYRTNIESN